MTTPSNPPTTTTVTVPVTTVTFALVGAGIIGPRHAQSILSNPSATLIAIIDQSPYGAEFASRLSIPHYREVSDFLTHLDQSSQTCDAALVCTPNDTHVPITTLLLEHGIHVLSEKPLATTIESGKTLLAHHVHLRATRYPNLNLLVGHHRRFNSYITATKKSIDSGSLGTIIAVNGLWCLFKPQSYFEPPCDWRRGADAGVILTNLVHDVDVLQYLLGPITRVHAEQTRPQRHTDATPHVADEGAAMTFRFASGVVGTFLVSDTVPSPYNFEAGTGENPLLPKEPDTDFYRIFGTKGTISVPDLTRWSYDKEEERSWLLPLTKERLEVGEVEVPFDAQIQHFVDVVRGKEEPRCGGEEALRALVVCDAVRRSMSTGETVDIEVDMKL